MSKKPYFLTASSIESPWVQCGGEYLMAVTVNPDPQTHGYDWMPPEDQIEYIKVAIYLAIEKSRGTEVSEFDFELTKAGNIHAHGVVRITNPKMNPKFKAIQLGKHIARTVGRRGVPWFVSVWVDCNDDMKIWREYCSKDSLLRWEGEIPRAIKKSNSIENYINVI